MRITTTYWVAALALIAIGIGVRQGIFRNSTPTPTQKTDQYQANVSITSGNELAGDPRLTASKEAPSANVYQSATSPAKRVIGMEARDQGEPVSIGSQTSDPAAVIGRAFPVAAAVEVDCKRRGRDDICDDVHDKLSKMAQEPRDTAWAAEMEAVIQHDVLSEEPGRFRIRSIECRTSLCAAEVESTLSVNGVYGSYMGGMQPHHDTLRANLKTNLNTFAYEIDPSGARVTVTVITFSRL